MFKKPLWSSAIISESTDSRGTFFLQFYEQYCLMEKNTQVYQVIYMYLILQIWKGIHKQQTRPNLYKQNIYTVFRRMLAYHKCAKWMLFIVPMNASTLTYKFLYRVITIKGCFIRPRKGRNIDGNAEMSIFV